jgi:pimeloyl-ACP methyl ester carboxylesterase
MKIVLIFSHGFGVRKDDRGLFTDIAASLPAFETIMFDYNKFNEAVNTLIAAPLGKQVNELRQVITDARAAHPDAIIDLVCHSQGCVIAAMLQPDNVRKVIFLAPPDHFASVDKKIAQMQERPGTKLNEDGSISFPRRDGSTTIIPKVYWDSRQGVNPMKLYKELADQCELVVVQADQDEVIGDTDFSELEGKAKLIHMNTNHDFKGEARYKIAAVIAKELEAT